MKMFAIKLDDRLSITCGPNPSILRDGAVHPTPQLGDLSIDAGQAGRSTSVSPADDAGEIVLVTGLHREWPATVPLARILPCNTFLSTPSTFSSHLLPRRKASDW